MHRVEQGLAPEHVVLAGLDAEQGLFTHFSAVEHESIENLAGRTAVIALSVTTQVRATKMPPSLRRPRHTHLGSKA
ncbi:hypothetical protein D3C78_1762240 [compost metagenome]